MTTPTDSGLSLSVGSAPIGKSQCWRASHDLWMGLEVPPDESRGILKLREAACCCSRPQKACQRHLAHTSPIVFIFFCQTGSAFQMACWNLLTKSWNRLSLTLTHSEVLTVPQERVVLINQFASRTIGKLQHVTILSLASPSL